MTISTIDAWHMFYFGVFFHCGWLITQVIFDAICRLWNGESL